MYIQNIINKSKREDIWGKVSAIYMTDKRLISLIYQLDKD